MTSNEKRRLIERGIVRALIGHMQRRGFEVFRTYDGGEYQYPATTDAAIAACFNLDEVSLRFVPHAYRREVDEVRGSGNCDAVREVGERAARREHGVLLVMGNGEDIISDWGYSDGDADGFNAAMGRFFSADGEPYGRDMEEVGRRAASDADRIAILAGDWHRDGDSLAVLFMGREGLRRIGIVPAGYETWRERADALLVAHGLSAGRLSVAEVDAYPGGWKKRAIVAHA